jgi:hypothetical protein
MGKFGSIVVATVSALALGAPSAWADNDNSGQSGPNDNLPVYLDRKVHATAEDTCTPGFIWQGAGSTATTFQRKRNEDAGIELAIKGLLRQGADIPSTYVDGHGLVHIEVPTGPQPSAANRAAWNFTYSYDVAIDPTNPNLDSYEAELWIDLDPSEHTDYLKLKLAKIASPSAAGPCPREKDLNGYGWKAGSTVVIGDDEGTDRVSQNSQNLAFYASLIDSDPDTKGIQPYTFGPGQFDVVMTIKEKGRSRQGSGHSKTVLHVVFDVVATPTQTP